MAAAVTAAAVRVVEKVQAVLEAAARAAEKVEVEKVVAV